MDYTAQNYDNDRDVCKYCRECYERMCNEPTSDITVDDTEYTDYTGEWNVPNGDRAYEYVTYPWTWISSLFCFSI